MRGPARVVWGALAGLACVWGSHWLMTAAPASPWNSVALLAPMLTLIALVCWRTRRRNACSVALASLAGLVITAASGHEVPQRTLFLGQHVAIHLFLAVFFGVTLRRGGQALISGVALRVHGRLTPPMLRYTRSVTAAWTIYFAAMAALSLALFAFAAFEDWAFFANWLTPLAVAAMFAGEHFVRYRLHPEFERVTMARAIAAYARPGAAGPATGSAPRRPTDRLTEPT